jgi:predicted RNA binding protein YcfA (HicA-like mRNA interferase family)
MKGYYNQVVAVLKQHGFFLVRHNGTSHQTWSNGKTPVSVSTNCYSRHTANGIMKDAGITHKF